MAFYLINRLARLGKSLLKALLTLLLALLILAFLYVAFNTPLTSSVRKLSNEELQTYTKYLDTSLSEPQHFVAEKFDRYDVVLLGEMHWKRQDVEFVNKLIPYLYRTKGIKIFAWEYGASDFQSEADSLINAPKFDRKRAIAFSRRSYFAWNFEEYLDIIRTIWEINQSIPNGQEKFTFLQLGSDYNPRKLQSPDIAVQRKERRRYAYDEKMGKIVEREVLRKHQKALWYSGLHHAFTQYKQPLFLFLKARGVRGGEYLYQRFERIYMIQLYLPFVNRLVLPKYFVPSIFGKRLTFVYPFRGAFEQVYREYKKPFAVDTKNSVFGDLEDTHGYYSMDRWGGLKLREMCDGYIVLCSIDEMEPVSLVPDWVTNEAELEEVKSILPPEDAARMKDIPTLLKYLEGETQRSQVKEMRNLGNRSNAPWRWSNPP
ncbi:MAG TPA: hypothetical protein VGQ81_07240, partial [Acidobacteriota bacterium]|nr:hypothetical protein [Acidobacteriota bacterium]